MPSKVVIGALLAVWILVSALYQLTIGIPGASFIAGGLAAGMALPIADWLSKRRRKTTSQ